MTDIKNEHAIGAPTQQAELEADKHGAGAGLIKPFYDDRLANEDLAPLKKQTLVRRTTSSPSGCPTCTASAAT